MISRRIVVAGMAMFPAACATSNDSALRQAQPSKPETVPLPEAIKLSFNAVRPTVPAEMAFFEGKWGGKWDGFLASNLYVESIDPDGTTTGVYAWDNAPDFRPTRGAVRFKGIIKNGILAWGTNTRFEFRAHPDGKLSGTRYIGDTGANHVVMTKMST